MLRHKAAAYAISAMVELSRHGHNGAARELCAGVIAQKYGLPVSYTAKILGHLARASLLRSGRGPNGGFALLRDPGSINLFEILKAVGALESGQVDLAEPTPDTVQTNLNGVLEFATGRAHQVFEETTLADLLNSTANNAVHGGAVDAVTA